MADRARARRPKAAGRRRSRRRRRSRTRAPAEDSSRSRRFGWTASRSIRGTGRTVDVRGEVLRGRSARRLGGERGVGTAPRAARRGGAGRQVRRRRRGCRSRRYGRVVSEAADDAVVIVAAGMLVMSVRDEAGRQQGARQQQRRERGRPPGVCAVEAGQTPGEAWLGGIGAAGDDCRTRLGHGSGVSIVAVQGQAVADPISRARRW